MDDSNSNKMPQTEQEPSKNDNKPNTTFESLVKDLLESVGVLKDPPSVAEDDTVLRTMDQWLELDTANMESYMLDSTVEDCAPFDATVYQKVAAMAIHAWNNTAETSSSTSSYSNIFIQHLQKLQQDCGIQKEEALLEQMSLQFVPSIRCTTWIRQWMDCNVQGGDLVLVDDREPRTLTHYLLLGDNNGQSPSYAPALMQALFQHLTNLPTLQSQLLLFHQAFQRGDLTINNSTITTVPGNNDNQKQTTPHHHHAFAPRNKHSLPSTPQSTTTTTTTTTALQDPTQRLHHYQIAQQLATKLNAAYQQHLDILEYILGDFYQVSTPSLRQLARAGLGQRWMKFQLANTTATASTGNYATHLRGENTSASGLDVSLRLLYRILRGMALDDTTASSNHHLVLLEDLLFHQLLPLHQPNAMVLWRDQTSLLELYHEPLVQCMAHILSFAPHWIGPTCLVLTQPSESIWPLGGNTPKQVLLLHEVDTFLGMLLSHEKKNNNDDNNDQDATTIQPTILLDESTFLPILTTVAQCMASEHSRLAERALTMMRNAYFKHLIYEIHYEASLKVLLPALTRSNSTVANEQPAVQQAVPWNPTVRKMTFFVLTNLQHHQPAVFAQVCRHVFDRSPKPATTPLEDESEQKSHPKSSLLANSNHHNNNNNSSNPSTIPAFNQRFSLQAGMGNWRPPPSKKVRGQRTNMPPPSARPPSNKPPLSVTGVAPWASSAPSNQSTPPATVTGIAPWANNTSSNKINPPVTVTGVAPWAVTGSTTTTGGSLSQKRPGLPPPKQGHRPPQPPLPMPPVGSKPDIIKNVTSVTPVTKEAEEPEEYNTTDTNNKDDTVDTESDSDDNPGLARVLNFMEKCKPPGLEDEDDENASSSWSKAQMSETPTLLPKLNFHDLVFGHELGRGAFGVVKYARLIDRTKTRSQWPEYAVKVIATEKMKELGYEYSVAREIACLRVMSHPNIARLVSSFRFQQGAYLVLEYASGGDLHQLLQQHGSLDQPSTQFVMGEVVAALASMHDDLGFVYGDLKPENIVLSETGHVKLTDFGACRPYTSNGKALLQSQMGKSGKNLLSSLREGDPRTLAKQQKQKEALEGISENNESEEEESCWASTAGETTTKQAGLEGKLINDDTMEVVEEQLLDDDQEVVEDMRIEGTTAYLPPEVVMGSIPTPAADSWALGCVLYQCLSGRPPIIEDDDAMTRNRIVTFDHSATSSGRATKFASDDNDPLFGKDQKHAAEISDTAKSLVRSLLNRVPEQRLTMSQVASHSFFEGKHVMSLYQQPAYPLDVGDVGPAPPDAQWSRRNFSSIWAPQPHAYDISGDAGALSKGASSNGTTSSTTAPISEGKEAGTSFAASNFYRFSGVPKAETLIAADGSNKQEAARELAEKHADSAVLVQQALPPTIEEDDASMASAE